MARLGVDPPLVLVPLGCRLGDGADPAASAPMRFNNMIRHLGDGARRSAVGKKAAAHTKEVLQGAGAKPAARGGKVLDAACRMLSIWLMWLV